MSRQISTKRNPELSFRFVRDDFRRLNFLLYGASRRCNSEKYVRPPAREVVTHISVKHGIYRNLDIKELFDQTGEYVLQQYSAATLIEPPAPGNSVKEYVASSRRYRLLNPLVEKISKKAQLDTLGSDSQVFQFVRPGPLTTNAPLGHGYCAAFDYTESPAIQPGGNVALLTSESEPLHEDIKVEIAEAGAKDEVHYLDHLSGSVLQKHRPHNLVWLHTTGESSVVPDIQKVVEANKFRNRLACENFVVAEVPLDDRVFSFSHVPTLVKQLTRREFDIHYTVSVIPREAVWDYPADYFLECVKTAPLLYPALVPRGIKDVSPDERIDLLRGYPFTEAVAIYRTLFE